MWWFGFVVVGATLAPVAVSVSVPEHVDFARHFSCPFARVWLEHGAERAAEILGVTPHATLDEEVPRCTIGPGVFGGAHQHLQSPGYSETCAGTPAEGSPYMWPLRWKCDMELSTMPYGSDAVISTEFASYWYRLDKNWKRNDVNGREGIVPAFPPTTPPNRSTIQRGSRMAFLTFEDASREKITDCYWQSVPVGNIRPDWFLDSRGGGLIDVQYIGNEHISHRGKPRLVKKWRKKDFADDYFVSSIAEFPDENGIHWPLVLNIPGEGLGPDSLRVMYNHELLFEDDDDAPFKLDLAHIASGGECPEYTPPDQDHGYVCGVCGHSYSASVDGSGADFEDLPEDWKCPVCGSSKSEYHKGGGGGGDSPSAHAAHHQLHAKEVPSELKMDPISWRSIEWTDSPVWSGPGDTPCEPGVPNGLPIQSVAVIVLVAVLIAVALQALIMYVCMRRKRHAHDSLSVSLQPHANVSLQTPSTP